MNKQNKPYDRLELAIAAGASAWEVKTIDPDGGIAKELYAEEDFLRVVYAKRHAVPKRLVATSRFYVLWIAASLLATVLVLAALRSDEPSTILRQTPSGGGIMIAGEEAVPAAAIDVPADTRNYGPQSLREMVREDIGETKFDTCVWIFEERQIRVQNADEAMIREVEKLLAGYAKETSGMVTLECKVFDVPLKLCEEEIIADTMKNGSAFLDEEREKALVQWLQEQGVKAEAGPRLLLLSRQRGSIAIHTKEISYVKSYVVHSTPQATTLDPVIEKAMSGHSFSFRCKPSDDGKFIAVSMRYENFALGDLIKKRKIIEEGSWAREALVENPEISALSLDYNTSVPNDSAVFLQFPVADAAIAAKAVRFGVLHVSFSDGN